MYLGPNLPLNSLLKPAKTGPKDKKPLPPPKKRITSMGKVAIKWKETRIQWLIDNKPDKNNNYICGICMLHVGRSEVTLDHIIPRSRAPHLRFEQTNLQAAHWKCNGQKGSKVL